MSTIQTNTGGGNITVNATTVWDRIVKLEENVGVVGTPIKEQIDGLSSQLVESANKLKNYESVLKYGADPTKTQDSTQAFIDAMQNNEIVLVPTGTYKLSSALTIQSSYKVRKIIGIDKDSTKLYFTGTDGVVNSKSGVILEGLGIIGNNTNKGVKMLSPIQMRNCQVYNFDVGIDLSNQVHIVTSYFEKMTIAYNVSYGIKIVSGGNWQNNGITFKDLYIVKNGTDADTLTSNGTTSSGDGMLIDGGYAIVVDNCIFEYNTGAGLRIQANSYPLYGSSIISPYFERNKYANMYVNNNSTYAITNLSISGEIYTDAGLTPVSNALSERKMYVAKPNKLLTDHSGNNWGKYSFADRNLLNRRSNMMNAFPVNFMLDMAVDYPSNIMTYSGEQVFGINATVGGATLYSELMYIDPSYNYVFSYDIVKVGATVSPNLLAILYNNETDAQVGSNTTNLNTGAFAWKTQSKIITPNGAKILRLYLNIEGTKPSDCEIYVKNIRLIPINKNPLYNGFNVAVSSSATTLAVTLSATEPDTNFSVSVSPAWNTTYWITNKTTAGFTINFGTAPVGATTLDWSIRR